MNLQVLKGSWDLVTRVIIRVTKVLITLLTKSHDPPSRGPEGFGAECGIRPPARKKPLSPCSTVGHVLGGSWVVISGVMRFRVPLRVLEGLGI